MNNNPLKMLASAATRTKSQQRHSTMLQRTASKKPASKGVRWTSNENKQLLNFLRNKSHYVPVTTGKARMPVIRWRVVTLKPNMYPLLIARMRVNERGNVGKHLLKRLKYMYTHGLLPNNVRIGLGLP